MLQSSYCEEKRTFFLQCWTFKMKNNSAFFRRTRLFLFCLSMQKIVVTRISSNFGQTSCRERRMWLILTNYVAFGLNYRQAKMHRKSYVKKKQKKTHNLIEINSRLCRLKIHYSLFPTPKSVYNSSAKKKYQCFNLFEFRTNSVHVSTIRVAKQSWHVYQEQSTILSPPYQVTIKEMPLFFFYIFSFFFWNCVQCSHECCSSMTMTFENVVVAKRNTSHFLYTHWYLPCMCVICSVFMATCGGERSFPLSHCHNKCKYFPLNSLLYSHFSHKIRYILLHVDCIESSHLNERNMGHYYNLFYDSFCGIKHKWHLYRNKMTTWKRIHPPFAQQW